MTLVLGREFVGSIAAHFAGRLYPATFEKFEPATIDPDDAAGAEDGGSAVYACDAIALGYKERDVDGTLIKKGDYKVLITLGSIAAVVDDAEGAVLDLASVTSGDLDTIIAATTAGAAGNLITVELRGDSTFDAGELMVTGTHVAVRFKADTTTRAELETLLHAAGIIDIQLATSSPSVALTAGDAFVSTPLAGGVDNSTVPADVVPNPSDTITVPPPGDTVAKTGRIIDVLSITQATITVQVRGLGE